MLMKLQTEKTDKIKINVFFLSYFEKKIGMNNPQMAIVKVNELMKSPTAAIEILK